MKAITQTEDKLYKTIGYTFSAFNLIFLIRMGWMILNTPAVESRTLYVLLGFSLLGLLFTIVGFQNRFKSWFLFVYSIPGSIIWTFGIFIILKKGVRQILLPESFQVYSEISFWFITLFMWLAGTYLFIFLRSLISKVITPQEKDQSQNWPARIMFIGLLLILALIMGYWIYTQVINPLPVYANFDPEYSYMLNSATPFIDLELYKRMDHPGTFMQLIGTGITILLKPLSLLSGSQPHAYLVMNPQVFLFCARFLILVLNIAVIYSLFRHNQAPKDWSTVLVGLSTLIVYFSLHTQSFEFLTIWSPNAFNFAIGSYLLFLLYVLLTKQEQDQQSLWMLSLAIGLGATFHIYMITLLITLGTAVFFVQLFEGMGLIKAVIAGLKNLLGAGIGYFIGTLVILPYYGSYIQWIKDIIIHQGTYGGGEVGVSSISSLIRNLQGLVVTQPLLFIFLLLSLLTCLILLIINRKQIHKAKRIWALIIGIHLQLAGLILIISKHPVNRYLLSAASLMPIILLLIHKLFEIYKVKSKFFFSLILAVSVFFLFKNIFSSLQSHNYRNEYLLSYSGEVKNLLDDYSSIQKINKEELEIYWTYGTYSPCYSLWFGNDFSKRRYTDEILNQCPNDLQYDIWDETISYTDETGLESLFDEQKNVILVGNRSTIEKYQNQAQVEIIRSLQHNLSFIVYQAPQQ